MTESEPSCPECLEQSRIIGKGAERELAYQAMIAELEARIALADRLARAARQMHRGCFGSKVGGGDGQTYTSTMPSAAVMIAVNEALAAYEAKP